MKYLKKLLLITPILLMGIFQSCHHHLDFFDCVEGEGSKTSQSFDLNDFEGIDLMIDARVHLTQGPDQSVIIEAQENVLDEMDLHVRKGILHIDFDHCVRDERTVDIFITIPDIESLKIHGSGSIFGENTIETKDLNVSISGSGDMDLDVEADLIDGKISGSGDVRLSGVTEKLDYKITGSGDFEAFRLEVDDACVRITGSGDMELFVNDNLKVDITGSGDVEFLGHPKLDIRITGSGEVIDVN